MRGTSILQFFHKFACTTKPDRHMDPRTPALVGRWGPGTDSLAWGDCSARHAEVVFAADTRSPCGVSCVAAGARHRRPRGHPGGPFVGSRPDAAHELPAQHRGVSLPGAEPGLLRGSDHGRRPRRRRQRDRRRVSLPHPRLPRQRRRDTRVVRGGSYRQLLREGRVAGRSEPPGRDGREPHRGCLPTLRRSREPRPHDELCNCAAGRRPLRRRPRSRAGRHVAPAEAPHDFQGRRHDCGRREHRLRHQAAPGV